MLLALQGSFGAIRFTDGIITKRPAISGGLRDFHSVSDCMTLLESTILEGLMSIMQSHTENLQQRSVSGEKAPELNFSIS